MALGPVVGPVGTMSTGLFVGFVLGTALKTARPSVKVVTAILGAALGGVPVAFLGEASANWAYPVGLLIGISLHRLNIARTEIAAKWNPRATPQKVVLGWFAWADLVAILSAIVFAYSFVVYREIYN